MEKLPANDPVTSTKQKIVYLDHVKVLMTVLVILHHTVITYGGPGGWYYRHPATSKVPVLLMTLFVSTNQAFFMGLFFLLSAYFVEPSLRRKGPARFTVDRLKRLGIPLLFYSFIFSPVLIFLVYRYGEGHNVTFMQFLGGFDGWINFGVLWFAAALLLFTLTFTLGFAGKLTGHAAISRLTTGKIIVFALALGAVSFLVRLVFPVGWVLKPVGFQLGHFPQYIAMFVVGIMASRGRLAAHLDLRLGKRFAWMAGIIILVVFPLLGLLLAVYHHPGTYFNGGWRVESLVYSFYEQLLGISIMVALTAISRHKWNQPSAFMAKLSRGAFAAYIFHPLVVIGLSLLLRGLNHPLLELAIVAPLAVVLTFVLAGLIVKILVVKNII
ncbi:MAG TPA: acyltransferase [Chitinophagaceae bacterium]|nr:acyltransferase [Chitinophagaceae bacterium]